MSEAGTSPGSAPAGLDLTAFRQLSYGLYVVTARLRERRNGCLVNAFQQVTEQPCLVALSLSKSNLTHEMVTATGRFAVQVLEQGAPLGFLGRFGFRSGRERDKLAGVSWRDGTDGCPVVLEHTLAGFEARVTEAVDCGTHTLFIGEVLKSESLGAGEPLTYAYYHAVKGGRTGRHAPGYRAFESDRLRNRGSSAMKRYVCVVCGYVYAPEKGDPDNDVEPGTPFEKLPDDWVCPICGAGKDQFEPE